MQPLSVVYLHSAEEGVTGREDNNTNMHSRSLFIPTEAAVHEIPPLPDVTSQEKPGLYGPFFFFFFFFTVKEPPLSLA